MDFNEIFSGIMAAWEAGAWVAMSVIILQAVIFGLKKIKAAWEPAKKFAKPAVIVLGAVVGVLSAIVGGLPVGQALLVFAATGLSPFIHDLVHHFGWLKHEEEEEDEKPAEKPETE